jgi:predicted ATPase
VLATSREALGVSGEVVWRVSPLAVPPDDAEPLSSRSDASAAVQLFVDRAVAALPGFALTEQNTSAIARICRRLDGIPLALELAAALVPALTVEQMGVCLDDAVGLLTAGNRTAPARHRALRATLDWSYDLLTEPERVVLRRAAVFAGGWSLAAAEWVCAGDQPASTAHAGPGRSPPAVATSDVLHLLVRLLAKSLVHAEREVSGPAPEARYRLLETVRQYATEQLRAVGEEELVRRRHSAWCASLSEQAEPGLHGADQVAWLVRLDREYDNIRAALAWCLEHDPPLGLHIAASLWQFWRMRLFLTEGRQWLEQLLAGAPAPTLARARGLTAAGTLANWQLDVVVARDRYEAALELARTLDDRALVGRIMRELGSLTAVRFGDHRRAWALFDEGLALSRAADDHGNVAVNLMQQGRLAAVEGSYRRAQRLLDESVILLSQVGDRWQLAIALEDAGGVALIVGQPERATSLFDEALAIGQGVEAAGLGTLHRRYHLGTVAYWRGDAPTALAWYEQGLAMTRAKEHIAGMTDNLIGLGRAVLLQGDVMRASELFTESLRLSEARGDLSGAALALHGLGLVDWHMGDAARAFTHLRESLRLRRDLDDHLGMAECLEALGAVAAGCATSREAAERAVGWLGAADALRERLGAPRPPVDQPTYTAAMSVSRTWLDHPASAAAAGASEPLAAVLADLLPAQSIG